jgi:hypothetical protein
VKLPRYIEIVPGLGPMGPMIDITEPNADIEFLVKNDKQVVWVNVGGVCRLRICRIGQNKIILSGPQGFEQVA